MLLPVHAARLGSPSTSTVRVSRSLAVRNFFTTWVGGFPGTSTVCTSSRYTLLTLALPGSQAGAWAAAAPASASPAATRSPVPKHDRIALVIEDPPGWATETGQGYTSPVQKNRKNQP